jgi:hypothetical protein
VDNLISGQEMSRDETINLIAKYDKSQKAFFRYAFQIDLDAPGLYDLIFNLGKMKKRTIAGLIVEAVQSDDIQSCSLDALSSMTKLSLERKIHAELIENNIDVRTLDIAVSEAGSAEIAGAVVSKEKKDRATAIVKNVNGILYVNNNLSVLPYHL